MDPFARLRLLLERLSQPVRRAATDRRRGVGAAVAALVVLGLAVPVGLAVTGRAGGSAGSAADGTAASGASRDRSLSPATGGADEKAVAPAAPDSVAGPATAGRANGSDAAPGADPLAGAGVQLARTAWLGVKVGDLAASSARARVVTSEAGGVVTYENVVTAADPSGRYGAPGGVSAPDGTGGTGGAPEAGDPSSVATQPVAVDEARMVLSVPSGKLDGVLTELSRLGSVSYRSSQSEDVTDTWVDARARIQPARDSIARVRALLARATDLQQVVQLESELSRRQADLDALVQRLASLDRRTSSSEVTLTLWTAATTAAVAASGDDLASRLRGAWDGLLGSATVILTGLAALLPWLVLVGLAALVVTRVRRRRGPGRPAGAGAVATAPPSAD